LPAGCLHRQHFVEEPRAETLIERAADLLDAA